MPVSFGATAQEAPVADHCAGVSGLMKMAKVQASRWLVLAVAAHVVQRAMTGGTAQVGLIHGQAVVSAPTAGSPLHDKPRSLPLVPCHQLGTVPHLRGRLQGGVARNGVAVAFHSGMACQLRQYHASLPESAPVAQHHSHYCRRKATAQVIHASPPSCSPVEIA